ncbi:uncharacterized protein [Euphorbia lathyris]|uniref:uncharacterized protein isoform X4 n=1 Tax=Euphorbia lathyris TaxID=212925 RepID=UPI0033142458
MVSLTKGLKIWRKKIILSSLNCNKRRWLWRNDGKSKSISSISSEYEYERAMSRCPHPIPSSAFNNDGSIYAYSVCYDWSKDAENHNPQTAKTYIYLHSPQSVFEILFNNKLNNSSSNNNKGKR